MRKRYRVLLIAAVVAALVVPFGYALSVESQPPSATVLARAELAKTTAGAVVVAPVLIRAGATSAAATAALPPSNRTMPDAGKLLLVGTALFFLSALVRKTI